MLIRIPSWNMLRDPSAYKEAWIQLGLWWGALVLLGAAAGAANWAVGPLGGFLVVLAAFVAVFAIPPWLRGKQETGHRGVILDAPARAEHLQMRLDRNLSETRTPTRTNTTRPTPTGTAPKGVNSTAPTVTATDDAASAPAGTIKWATTKYPRAHLAGCDTRHTPRQACNSKKG